jgi:ribosomal-protein-alanine N-acetyltransferase
LIASENCSAKSPADIRIEILTADHLPAVMAIERASFRDPWTMTSFRDLMIQMRTNWTAFADECVAGYLITQWVLDEIHILNIAVSGNYHRRGIASGLMRFLQDSGRERNMQAIFLEVRVSNEAAIAFYKQFGFSVLSTRKKYYQDGENALVMCNHLTERAGKNADGETSCSV